MILAAARGRIGSFKNRIFSLRTTPGPIPADRLRTAMRTGLEDQVAHLRSPSDSFSLPSWRKWARLMTDTRNAKAWPRVFADGEGLFGSLLSLLEWVDGDVGPYGGHLRELYAVSLDEAAVALDIPALDDAARAWRGVADQWEELADAAVPPDLEGAAEAVDAVETLHDAVRAGEPGRARVTAASEITWAIANAMSTTSRCQTIGSPRSSRISGIAWPRSMPPRSMPSRRRPGRSDDDRDDLTPRSARNREPGVTVVDSTHLLRVRVDQRRRRGQAAAIRPTRRSARAGGMGRA